MEFVFIGLYRLGPASVVPSEHRQHEHTAFEVGPGMHQINLESVAADIPVVFTGRLY